MLPIRVKMSYHRTMPRHQPPSLVIHSSQIVFVCLFRHFIHSVLFVCFCLAAAHLPSIDDFKFLKVISRGGYGTVYLGINYITMVANLILF